MSSVSVISPAVPSCSSSGTAVKRKHDSDSDSSGIKIPKGNFYIVLESESDIPSSDDETESFLSLQNKSTDFAKDTSDTSSKSSHSGSDFEVEFEVVSMSEQEVKVPFDGSCSGTDLDTLKKRLVEDTASEDSESSVWADNSSGPDEPHDWYTIPTRLRSCIKCKAPTCVHYCLRCYKVRKDFFPPRPKINKRKKATRSYLKKKTTKEPPKTLVTELNESGIESGCSQELSTSDDKPHQSLENDNLCNICLKNPKDGAFVHCRWVHIYACYECSIKTWFTSRRCPLCNGKVNKVLKVAMG